MSWITPHLGSGLGNRLFQYAAAAGLAELWDRPLRFVIQFCAGAQHGPIASIFRMYPTVPLINASDSVTELKEPPNAFYDYVPFGDTPPPGLGAAVVQGYRQSPLYFPRHLETLMPDWNSALGGPLVRSLIDIDSHLHTLAERKRTVSIHIRLGDYLKLPQHQTDLGKYYAEALAKVEAGSRLHLFSDEPERCAQIFIAFSQKKQLDFTIAKLRSDVESLYEMSLCLGGNIVANSTFSWWGAWFAHYNGSPWATYPDNWGKGQPEPTELFPTWATILSV